MVAARIVARAVAVTAVVAVAAPSPGWAWTGVTPDSVAATLMPVEQVNAAMGNLAGYSPAAAALPGAVTSDVYGQRAEQAFTGAALGPGTVTAYSTSVHAFHLSDGAEQINAIARGIQADPSAMQVAYAANRQVAATYTGRTYDQAPVALAVVWVRPIETDQVVASGACAGPVGAGTAALLPCAQILAEEQVRAWLSTNASVRLGPVFVAGTVLRADLLTGPQARSAARLPRTTVVKATGAGYDADAYGGRVAWRTFTATFPPRARPAPFPSQVQVAQFGTRAAVQAAFAHTGTDAARHGTVVASTAGQVTVYSAAGVLGSAPTATTTLLLPSFLVSATCTTTGTPVQAQLVRCARWVAARQAKAVAGAGAQVP